MKTVISQDNLNSLTYHKNHKEYMLCLKGMFLECWYMTDPNGNPTELLKPLLDYDEATREVRGWKRQNRPAGGGAQPSPPGNSWQVRRHGCHSAFCGARAASANDSGGSRMRNDKPAGTCGTTMDSRSSAELAQDQAMSVTDTAAAAGSAPSNACPATPSNSSQQQQCNQALLLQSPRLALSSTLQVGVVQASDVFALQHQGRCCL